MRCCLAWTLLLAVALILPGCGGGDSGSGPDSDAARATSDSATSNPATPRAGAPAPPPPPPPAPGGGTDTEPAQPQPVEVSAQLEPRDDGVADIENYDPEEQSMDNMEMIVESMLAYSRKNRHFPPPAIYDDADRPLLSWRVAVLPFLGEQKLYDRFRLDEPWDSDHNRPLAEQMPDAFKTPAGPAAPMTCYLAPDGMDTILSRRGGIMPGMVRDGLQSTLVVVEANPDRAVTWTQPRDWQFVPAMPNAGLGALHEGWFFAAAGDTIVHRIPNSLEPDILRALFTIAGGEPVDLGGVSEQPDIQLGKQPGEEAFQPSVGSEFLDEARRAFAEGHEAEAIIFLTADAVASDGEEVLGTLRWSPGLKRPVLAIRWGIASWSNIPAATQPEVMPGGPLDRRFFSSHRDRHPEAYGPFGGLRSAGIDRDQALDAWARTIGQPLVQRLQTRVAEGYFGSWLAEVQHSVGPGAGANAGGNGAKGPQVKRLPGIVVAGVVDPSKLLKSAAEEGLDLVMIAAVAAKAGRQGTPQTILVLRILDVVKNKELYASKPLSSLRVSDNPDGVDPVAKFTDEAMSFIDENFRLREMPDISRPAALRRAKSLVAGKHGNPLPVMMELRYYEWKKLLTTEELAGHYGQLIGQADGQRLATGSELERLQVVSRWLPGG